MLLFASFLDFHLSERWQEGNKIEMYAEIEMLNGFQFSTMWLAFVRFTLNVQLNPWKCLSVFLVLFLFQEKKKQ